VLHINWLQNSVETAGLKIHTGKIGQQELVLLLRQATGTHTNEFGADAHVLPIQDAGLQEFLRTLEIKFSHIEPDGAVHVT